MNNDFAVLLIFGTGIITIMLVHLWKSHLFFEEMPALQRDIAIQLFLNKNVQPLQKQPEQQKELDYQIEIFSEPFHFLNLANDRTKQ